MTKYDDLTPEVDAFLGQAKHMILPFKEEFRRCNPQTTKDLNEFYKFNQGYLVANAKHEVPYEIQKWKNGVIADFGAGAGNCALFLAKENNCEVYCIEPNLLQAQFIKNIRRIANKRIEVMPALSFLRQKLKGKRLDGVVCRDVIEHLPDYRVYLKTLIRLMKSGGLMYAKPEFAGVNQLKGMHIHFGDKHKFEEWMESAGMERLEKYVWRKK